jgi:hypothetical protein
VDGASEWRTAIGIDQTQAQPDQAAVTAALAVLDRLMAALNGGNEPASLKKRIMAIPWTRKDNRIKNG